ncbi:MAG TPA: DNA gyrase inhibitor YacG [Steroidobacteraceae bacterium]|nr:DNA gyrase inhibitor YacG [Steroidobacteraceae bacterium]
MSPARVKCPTCQRHLEWDSAPFRPFCSERCRLIDLGAWLTEQRSIRGDTAQPAEEPGVQPPPTGSASDE